MNGICIIIYVIFKYILCVNTLGLVCKNICNYNYKTISFIDMITDQDNHEYTEEDIHNMKNSMLYEFSFKLPLEYHDHSVLSKTVTNDLELHNDALNGNIINHIYNNSNYKLLQNKYSSLYSTHKNFLKDNQCLVNRFSCPDNTMNDFIETYLEYKNDPDFSNKYQYVQYQNFTNLNRNVPFLQVLGMYNFGSPFVSLISPIIAMILPYFVFLYRGYTLSFSTYINIVFTGVMGNYFIKGIMNIHKNSLRDNAYLLMSIVFYILSIYNNINLCISFYHNLNYLIGFIEKYDNFLKEGLEMIKYLKSNMKGLKYFSGFYQDMCDKESDIINMKKYISSLTHFEGNVSKYSQIGLLLKCNYEIFNDENIHDIIMYLIYLNHYAQDLNALRSHVEHKRLNACTFISNDKHSKRQDKTTSKNKSKSKQKTTKIMGSYYLPLISNTTEVIVTNDVSLKKNIIITGPNASGKTTLIKSVFLNIFLSQSIGFGCYENCDLQLYHHFHSYLNIPDTSNRDSLFQAEARQCKDIYDFIKSTPSLRHFCIFDEIYSGTNPNDAVMCASIYLKGMNAMKKSVDLILTTHYIDLCQRFETTNKKLTTSEKEADVICNKKMDVDIICEGSKVVNHEYKYKMINGISKVNGGMKVLMDLNYPSELLDMEFV
jgi:energy-coupling factor transporter ATP-binding protein EcfA2